MVIEISELRIGQIVYYRKEEVKIIKLQAGCHATGERVHDGQLLLLSHPEEISIEPPKQKVKRWLWAISAFGDRWEQTEFFYSDDEMKKKFSKELESNGFKAVKLEWSEQEFDF